MKRIEALSHHAHMKAAVSLSLWLSLAGAAALAVLPLGFADILVATAFIIAFSAMMAGLATDLRSMRIPNELSLMLLFAAGLRWLGDIFGAGLLAGGPDGILRDVMGLFLPGQGTGSFIAAGTHDPMTAIMFDAVCMLIVFIPLYASFAFRLGFGGGDVKLITSGALYFGWPLGFDFLGLTYLVGAAISAGFLIARLVVRDLLPTPPAGSRRERLAGLRMFPYAPAIAAAAILCFAVQLEGLVR